MSKRSRILLPGYPHHVIQRGNNRRRLFSYSSDYRFFCECTRHGLAEHAVRLHAIALMSNHVHWIASFDDPADFPKFVQRVSQRYAQYRNQTRDGSGKLFEQRYLSFPILTEAQLAVTTAYIDLNPVRAGSVRDPVEYPWSTAAIHMGQLERSKIPLALWTPSSWYAAMSDDAGKRCSEYVSWIEETRARDYAPERVKQIEIIERLSALPYTRRLERPSRQRAA